MPRTQLPTSTQRRDTKNNEEKEGPGNSLSNDLEGPNTKTVEVEIRTDEKLVANFSKVPEVEESKNEIYSIDIEAASTNGPLSDQKISHYDEKGTLPKVVDNVMEPKTPKDLPRARSVYMQVSYTSENVVEGKKAAKEALQQRLGLKRDNLPFIGIISRLTHQKGIHLIKHAIWRTLERGGQVVLLGSAPDHRIQNDFVNLANQLHSSYNDRSRLCLSYDEPLSHLIYAGADFILVPSIFEPCGLTQLTAMRYGSIPIVRKTGGLYDTVFDADHDKERAQGHGLEPNGFNFDGADAVGVDYALNRAISAWYGGREWLNSLCKRVMEQDWSWNRPAIDYLELYHAARK